MRLAGEHVFGFDHNTGTSVRRSRSQLIFCPWLACPDVVAVPGWVASFTPFDNNHVGLNISKQLPKPNLPIVRRGGLRVPDVPTNSHSRSRCQDRNVSVDSVGKGLDELRRSAFDIGVTDNQDCSSNLGIGVDVVGAAGRASGGRPCNDKRNHERQALHACNRYADSRSGKLTDIGEVHSADRNIEPLRDRGPTEADPESRRTALPTPRFGASASPAALRA